MASFNRIIMIGNLTRDPDFKPGSGQGLCKLSIASNRQFKNKQTGSLVQEVCYIDVDVWGPQAESCRQYLQKGRPVLVEGRLKLDTWETEGQTKRKHLIVADRIVFLGSGQQSESVSDELGMAPATSAGRKSESGAQARRSAKKSGEDTIGDDLSDVTFKDEAPFLEEELPF